MLLLKRQQERERKAAEEAARRAEEKKLRDMAVHPLVRAGLNRDVRDAYLYGLVFAAIADDDKVDKNEKEALTDIAVSLCISVAEVNDAIGWVTSLPDDETIKGCEIGVKLFYSQFMLLLALHEHEAGELDECFLSLRFVDKTGIAFPMAKRHAVLKILEGEEGVDGAMNALADWMGDDALKYFVVKKYGDVSDILAKERKRGRVEQARRRKAAMREKAQQQLNAAIKFAISKYGNKGAISTEALEDIEKHVNGIDGDLIDWPSYCNDILDVPEGGGFLGIVLDSKERKKYRHKIWQLVALLMIDYKPEYSVMCQELRWLLMSSCITMGSWQEDVKKFMTKYLKCRVSF